MINNPLQKSKKTKPFNAMLRIEYGIANFENLRKDGGLYIDKTHFIPILERYKNFFFIRPRRFGKSLWLSVLQYYYDVLAKDTYDKLFGDLYIGKNPTERRSSYLILKFDFSGINSDNEESLKRSITEKIRITCSGFVGTYSSYLSDFSKKEAMDIIEQEKDISTMLKRLMEFFKTQKFYILIDEYDHFVNKLVSVGREGFARELIFRDGFIRTFFETLKEGSGKGIFERFFITGVSPIMLDELASGFNILDNKTLDIDFHDLMGFTDGEVKGVLDLVPDDKYTLKSKEEVYADLTQLYNGYKFNALASNKVFNSDMVLYFIEKFARHGYPDELLDLNVKTDYEKLRGLILGVSGKEMLQVIIEELTLSDIVNVNFIQRFDFEHRFEENELKSLLFYLGLLTFANERDELKIPNGVIRELYWEYFRKFLAEEKSIEFEFTPLTQAVKSLAYQGNSDNLRKLVSDFFKNKLSNYDYSNFSEKHVKFMFVSYLSMAKIYSVISERELPGGKRIDLLIYAHPAYYKYVKFDYVMEFKYINKEKEPKENQIKEDAIKQVQEYHKIYQAQERYYHEVTPNRRELKAIVIIVKYNKETETIYVSTLRTSP